MEREKNLHYQNLTSLEGNLYTPCSICNLSRAVAIPVTTAHGVHHTHLMPWCVAVAPVTKAHGNFVEPFQFTNFLQIVTVSFQCLLLFWYSHFMAVFLLCFQDLIETCVRYMKMNIVSASQQNYLIAWLQYTLTCGHSDISSVCLNHFKWNLEQVATHEDFASCDLDLLTTVLAEHDVVVHDEMTLYK